MTLVHSYMYFRAYNISLHIKAHMGTKGETCDPWFSLGNQGKEFERGYTQHIKIPSSMARNQETEYKKSPCGYNNIMGNQQFQSGSSSLMMPLSMMTPQEKIEKLRRRQQMRALLAICKQQQEFRQNSSITSCSNESQIDENLSTLVMNTSSLEDAILHQLENVVSTLGIQIRLCIRDSLFRLAQNALQRKYVISSNEQVPNVVTQERLGETKSSARKTDGETKTNPIDRIVAQLLFHRPPELSGEHLQSQG
ncbi:unnamed protein product [Lactuca saligna]|uniref:Uncharacterized protein n=1 Tax=Lactuca saligna TaxID=75948 RepID=A0AA35V2I2_LACSI|nr:unnamed protein product [Lactuca saligna]